MNWWISRREYEIKFIILPYIRYSIPYRIKHWMLKWVSDSDGDIGIVIFQLIAFVKYKEHTIIYFYPNNRSQFITATRWHGNDPSYLP